MGDRGERKNGGAVELCVLGIRMPIYSHLSVIRLHTLCHNLLQGVESGT